MLPAMPRLQGVQSLKFDKSGASVTTHGECWLLKTSSDRRESLASGNKKWDSGIRYDARRDYTFVGQYKGRCSDDLKDSSGSPFDIPAKHSLLEGTGRSDGMRLLRFVQRHHGRRL